MERKSFNLGRDDGRAVSDVTYKAAFLPRTCVQGSRGGGCVGFPPPLTQPLTAFVRCPTGHLFEAALSIQLLNRARGRQGQRRGKARWVALRDRKTALSLIARSLHLPPDAPFSCCQYPCHSPTPPCRWAPQGRTLNSTFSEGLRPGHSEGR